VTGRGKRSAGLLIYRLSGDALEVFLVHPGGPFWAKKDLAAWSIPKGEYPEGEEPLAAAVREFQEETGFAAIGDFVELGSVTQANGKVVFAWAHQDDFDAAQLTSNSCEIQWPPGSGRTITIPEVDRGGWFSIPEARKRILKGQEPLLERLLKTLDRGDGV
jgi:predicted NUDIX family NTP pyrophosphohydrolase